MLRFEVEGTSNTPIEYTIAQKNAWNWVDEFKTDSQGPIWTSQRQVSGKWQTITDFGADVYPQTYYDKYYASVWTIRTRTFRPTAAPSTA